MHQLCRALALSTKSILQYLIRLFGDIDFSLYLCTRSIKSSRSYRSGLANRASSERGRAIAQPSYSISATVVSTMWEIYSLQKTKSYATTHLLHQVCPAVRRHADSRVSKHLQFPGANAASILQPLVMAKPPLSHILSNMTYPTTS